MNMKRKQAQEKEMRNVMETKDDGEVSLKVE